MVKPTSWAEWLGVVERALLSKGLRYHLEGRLIVRGNKTVVFSG